MTVIYKSKYDYINSIGATLIITLLILIPSIGENGKFILTRIPLLILASLTICFLLFKKDIKKVTFTENLVTVYYPLLPLKEEYNYTDINKIKYTKYISNVGQNLILYVQTKDKQKKIIFQYYPDKNNLLPFLEEKGFRIEYGK